MATDWRMIRLEKDGPLAIVTLTNPPLNVLHPHMAAELDACFTGLATDADVVVAIVTGQGERAFCAGFDIKEFPNLMMPGGAERLARALHASLDKIAHLGKPTIAAVNGLALGGGLELSMACDLRIVAANAQLGQPEIKLGLFPGAGGTQRLPRLVGAGIAKELLYVGDPVSAEEAYRIGLANKVVPAGEALRLPSRWVRLLPGWPVWRSAISRRPSIGDWILPWTPACRSRLTCSPKYFKPRMFAKVSTPLSTSVSPTFGIANRAMPAGPDASGYQLLDTGSGAKLEQVGPYRLVRPAPQALWRPSYPAEVWDTAVARYHRQSSGGGTWTYKSKLPPTWVVTYCDLTLKVRLTDFGHLGFFAEHGPHWQWLRQYVQDARRPIRLLNVFAYTGGMSLAAAAAGRVWCIWMPRKVSLPGRETTRSSLVWPRRASAGWWKT